MASKNGFSSYADPEPPPTKAQILMKSRELLLEERLRMRMKEYVDIHPYLLFVGTWNVNGQMPSDNISLDPWLSGGFDGRPHFYVLGFQELDLDKRAYVIDHSIREGHWQKAVENSLRKKGTYKMVEKIRLVGIMLLVYVLESEYKHVTNISKAYLGTGIMGWMGNKGGVAIRFDFHRTTLCFVTAHFAAHTEEVERRNEDFRNIWNRLVFGSDAQLQYSKKIDDHDIILFCGDFNYRIAGLDRKQVDYHLTENLIERLVNHHDQLVTHMTLKKVFHGFSEGKITFRPTYKYDTGTDQWDSSEKFRVPSWCDRILWKSKEADDVKLMWYDSRMQMQLSDHKPVVALYQLGIKVEDPKRYKTVYNDILKNIDREENSLIPQAAVECQLFNFGDVTFAQSVTRQIVLANTGQVPFDFWFITPPGKQNYCEAWMSVTPERNRVGIGQVCYIEMKLEVAAQSAAALTAQKEKAIQDVLVLHLDGGKDFFITIDGHYIPSCFGMSLEDLSAAPNPIRPPSLQQTDQLLVDFAGDISAPKFLASEQIPPPADVPLEFWMMLVHLHIKSVDVPDLFTQPGLDKVLEKIRDHLDARLPLPLPDEKGHSVAEAMLLYLNALPKPLIPGEFYQECLDVSSTWTLCRSVVERFPKAHRATFKAFMVLLRELNKHWQRHPNGSEGTLEIIADSVLRTPAENQKRGAVRQELSKKKVQFLMYFLLNKMDDDPVLPRKLPGSDPGDVFQTIPNPPSQWEIF